MWVARIMCLRAALLFPVALARRAWFTQSGREIGVAEPHMDESLVDPDAESPQPVKQSKWRRFVKHFKGAYEPDPVISFSGNPYNYIGFFRASWTALPLSMYQGALQISGPLYRIIKLLESRELPISCPTLWADRGFHLYLSVTKPQERISSALTHAAVKVVTLGSLPSFLAQVLGHNAQHAKHALENVHGTMEQSDAAYEVGQEAIEEPGINATRTLFQRILHKFHQSKLLVQRVMVEKRIVTLMLGPKLVDGYYNLEMSCARVSDNGRALVHFSNSRGEKVPVTTLHLAVYILAVA
ncbi:unnamed protein product [Symbiodinium necroappetens]|uniref:Uncharacterized protein n=1 Tax=Symbiodinium necroappetens TaxID=1628268 RepID=A0A812RM84_9DINO|nr:unnamed protein product [Symbiodinium necroappetens]